MEKMFEIEEGSRNYDFEVKCVEKVVAFSPVIIKISVVYYVQGKGLPEYLTRAGSGGCV